jgi:hypothetical protein
MNQLIGPLLQVCCLRGSTSNLPYSRYFLILFIIFQWLLNYTIFSVYVLPEAGASLVYRLVVSLVCMIGITSYILYINKVSNRLNQTLLAFFGTDIIFSCARLALLVIVGMPMANVLLLFIYFWEITVRGFIVKCGIDTTMGKGILLAFVIQLIEEIPLIQLQPVALQ